MVTQKALLTAGDFLKLPNDGRFYELLDGALVELSPPGGMHGMVMATVGPVLLNHVEAHGLGVVLTGDPGIVLSRNPDRVRAPDVCFIATSRVRAAGIPTGCLELVPDLIVKVVSPGDTAAEVEQKIEEWLRAGVRLVWSVYSSTRSVVANDGFGSARIYAEADTLDGGTVLPGFSTTVSRLFI